MRFCSIGLALVLALACDGDPSVLDAGADGDAALDDAAVDDAASRDAGGARSDGSVRDASPDRDADRPRDAAVEADAGLAADGGSGSAIDALLDRLADADASAADLDALLHELAWSSGWPATDGARWVFATRWDDAPATVRLVSDVVGWDPAFAPIATRAASGAHYFVAIDAADFVAPSAGAKYKWHGDPGNDYRAPPEATAYGVDENGPFGYVAPPTDARWRERFPAFASAHLEAPRAFRALLPRGFVPGSAAAASARVLFMHDGQNVFDSGAPFGGWRVHEALDADPTWDDVVVLAVDNAPDRMSAYTHTPDDIGGGPIGGRADDYLDLVELEALPFFRARYGVAAAGDTLAIAGSSLGGLVSLYAALTRPTIARCVIAMSSTLGWGAFGGASAPEALVARWTARGPVSIYLDSGGGGTCVDEDEDGVLEDSDDRDNFCTTNQLRDHLDDLGYAFHVDLAHWWEENAGHNEAAWAARTPRALSACAAMGWE